MLHKRYQHMIRQTAPSDEVVQQVLDSAHQQEKQKCRTARRSIRPAAAILAACLGITIAMPALADNVELIYQAMYMVSPAVAQHFMPVHLSDEENGIRMEVESAYIHESTAEIYITMQDLTGDRIDDTLDLNDSYDIHLPFSSSAGCELVNYDAETRTARLYIRIDLWDEVPIEGDKITFSLGSFLSHKKEYDNITIPIDLSTVQAGAKTQEVELNGYSFMENYDMPDKMQALVPSAPRKEFPVDGVEMTGLAYVDGKLHVQIASEPSENKFDGNGYFWLVKNDGTIEEPSENFMYHIGEQEWAETADGKGHYVNSTRYDEYVLDIPQDEIGAYQLSARFVMTGMKVDGGWRVTFPLEHVEE